MRRLPHYGHLALNLLRMPEVIGIEWSNEMAFRLGNTEIAGACHAAVRLMYQANPFIDGCKVLDNSNGSVSTTVIHHNYFNIMVSLQ